MSTKVKLDDFNEIMKDFHSRRGPFGPKEYAELFQMAWI